MNSKCKHIDIIKEPKFELDAHYVDSKCEKKFDFIFKNLPNKQCWPTPI